MSNMQDWYAPLEERTSPESERKKKKPGKASWRIGGAILLVVLLIAAVLAAVVWKLGPPARRSDP